MVTPCDTGTRSPKRSSERAEEFTLEEILISILIYWAITGTHFLVQRLKDRSQGLSTTRPSG